MVKYKIVLIGLMAILYCGTANAEMYKWVDSTGTTHYAQLPPTGVDSEVIEQRGSKKSSYRRVSDDEEEEDEAEEDGFADDEFADDEEDFGEEQVALAGADALKNAEELAAAEKARIEKEERNICQIATKNLIGLESRPIVRVKDGDDYRVLSAKEKEAKTAQTREQITKYCR